jgi:hypothetical protein
MLRDETIGMGTGPVNKASSPGKLSFFAGSGGGSEDGV